MLPKLNWAVGQRPGAVSERRDWKDEDNREGPRARVIHKERGVGEIAGPWQSGGDIIKRPLELNPASNWRP